MKKPKILIVNDDGIFSEGIKALWEAMNELGDTFIAAPSREKSAASHSITLNHPIRVKLIERANGFQGWAISGTPVDCTKLAIRSLMSDKPDLLVSGINHGANLGTNIVYSGTVSAAMEGSILGIPSIAFSLASRKTHYFLAAKEIAKKVATRVMNTGLPNGTLLNVNIPNCDVENIQGIKITKQGNQFFKDQFDERISPRNQKYYWIKGEMVDEHTSTYSDSLAIKENYASITPIHYKLTNDSIMDDLKDLFVND